MFKKTEETTELVEEHSERRKIIKKYRRFQKLKRQKVLLINQM